jgi:hypothetical protein
MKTEFIFYLFVWGSRKCVTYFMGRGSRPFPEGVTSGERITKGLKIA